MEFKDVTCVLCQNKQFIPLYEGQDRLQLVPGSFQIVKCADCGLITILPRLSAEEISAYYPDDYVCYYDAIEDEKNWLRRMDRQRGRDRRCKVIVDVARQPGRILDVGCATGIFLSGMQKYGWECYGVEPSEYAASYARKKFGLNIFRGFLEESGWPDNYFDVVTLWDVLEHISDPANALDEINRILKPGGLLVTTMPNADSWERHWFGKYWSGWEVPRHYQAFTPETASRLFSLHHFEVEKIFSFTGRHGAMLLSLQFWISDWKASARFKNIMTGLFGSLPFRIIAHPYYLIAESINKSSTMTITSRKRMS